MFLHCLHCNDFKNGHQREKTCLLYIYIYDNLFCNVRSHFYLRLYNNCWRIYIFGRQINILCHTMKHCVQIVGLVSETFRSCCPCANSTIKNRLVALLNTSRNSGGGFHFQSFESDCVGVQVV
jgi:hypothetical protein